jgi:hypothetical protein
MRKELNEIVKKWKNKIKKNIYSQTLSFCKWVPLYFIEELFFSIQDGIEEEYSFYGLK